MHRDVFGGKMRRVGLTEAICWVGSELSLFWSQESRALRGVDTRCVWTGGPHGAGYVLSAPNIFPMRDALLRCVVPPPAMQQHYNST